MVTCFVVVVLLTGESETFTFSGQDARREAYEFFAEADDGFGDVDAAGTRWWCESPFGKTGGKLKREATK